MASKAKFNFFPMFCFLTSKIFSAERNVERNNSKNYFPMPSSQNNFLMKMIHDEKKDDKCDICYNSSFKLPYQDKYNHVLI